MGAPTIVQSTAISLASSRQQSISSPTIGNLLVGFVYSFYSLTAANIHDSAGNTVSLYGSHADANGNYCHIFTAPVTATAGTVTWSDSTHNANFQLNEITGFNPSTPFDGAFEYGTFSGSSGGTLTATAVTTTFANDLILSAAFDQNTAALSVNTGTQIAFLNTDGSSDTCISQQHTVSSTGSYAEKFNVPTSSGETAVIVVIAIMGTSGGGGGTSISPSTGAAALSGNAPALGLGETPPSGSVALSGNAPTLSQGTVETPSSGGVSYLGSAPVIGKGVSSTSGAVVLAGSIPKIGVGITPRTS